MGQMRAVIAQDEASSAVGHVGVPGLWEMRLLCYAFQNLLLPPGYFVGGFRFPAQLKRSKPWIPRWKRWSLSANGENARAA